MQNKNQKNSKDQLSIEKLEKELIAVKEELNKKTAQTELYKEMKFLTSKEFNLITFLDRITDRIIDITHTTSASILLLDEAEENLEFVIAKGPGSEKLVGVKIPSNEGIAGKVMQTGKHHISQVTKHDPDWGSKVADSIGYTTFNLLAVPLEARGKLKGVIEIINKKNGEFFGQTDVGLLIALSTEVAIAFENANLLVEARQRTQQLETLSKISTILNSSLDQKTVRLRTMEAIVELLDCETGSLYLIDAEHKKLVFEVALGEKGGKLKKMTLDFGEGIAGWVAQEGKSQLIPDTRKDARWADRADQISEFKTLNMVVAPIKVNNKVIGVLQALNKKKGKLPTEFDLNLLERLADQVAIALENAMLYEEQRLLFKETAQTLVTAIEKRDPYTGGHTKRVRGYCMILAKYLGLDSDTREWLELAAILHDTGKIGVDDQVLRKPGKLTSEEYEKMKSHPIYGHDIIKYIKSLKPILFGIKHHHERFDGQGYPDGLSKLQIPLIARIIAVADTWDAMTSDRPYRKGLDQQVALDVIKENRGTQFDPEIVDLFLKAYGEGAFSSS